MKGAGPPLVPEGVLLLQELPASCPLNRRLFPDNMMALMIRSSEAVQERFGVLKKTVHLAGICPGVVRSSITQGNIAAGC